MFGFISSIRVLPFGLNYIYIKKKTYIRLHICNSLFLEDQHKHTLHNNHLLDHYLHHKTIHGNRQKWTVECQGESGGPASFEEEQKEEL
jgi:hypothetical protein